MFSCTCFSYNSLIYKRATETINPHSPDNATSFALGYPAPSKAPSVQSKFALGYPAPVNNPSVQKAIALGYPASCNVNPMNTASRAITGFFAYTTYQGTPNIKRITYHYDGSKITLGVPLAIAATAGADGITTLPNGDLVVGGEEHETYLLSPQPGLIKTASVGDALSDHVTYDSQRNVIWTSGDNPYSDLAEIPLKTFAKGIIRQLKGDDNHITQLAFDTAHNAYYTLSPPQGNGAFGIVNLDTFITTRKINNLPAAHGIIFDHFTNTLILVGSNHITQINPSTFAIISDWKAPAQHSQLQLDQAATDGWGHLWITSNDGNIVFIDYSHTKKVNDLTNYQYVQFLENNLDDVALLCQS